MICVSWYPLCASNSNCGPRNHRIPWELVEETEPQTPSRPIKSASHDIQVTPYALSTSSNSYIVLALWSPTPRLWEGEFSSCPAARLPLMAMWDHSSSFHYGPPGQSWWRQELTACCCFRQGLVGCRGPSWGVFLSSFSLSHALSTHWVCQDTAFHCPGRLRSCNQRSCSLMPLLMSFQCGIIPLLLGESVSKEGVRRHLRYLEACRNFLLCGCNLGEEPQVARGDQINRNSIMNKIKSDGEIGKGGWH